jgi:hypothetical protein
MAKKYLNLLGLIAGFILLPFAGKSLQPELANVNSHPPRTIRVCCFFGSKVGIIVLPFIKFTEVTSIDKIGSHHFMGKTSENNGVIYTARGGFIDMGHLRDVADWTAWLYTFFQNGKYLGCLEKNLGYEGGEKKLSVSIPGSFSDEDILLLAGRIAYELSTWHEIATWFGVRTVPFVSEKFSSFSVEDPYSNLMGAILGMEAIRSELPYEEAMTRLIKKVLTELEAVPTEKETLQAMEAVLDNWWARKPHMPRNRMMRVRLTALYDSVYPMLIPETSPVMHQPVPLIIPSVTSSGDSLTRHYELSIRLNHRFPVKHLLPESENRTISQQHFKILIDEIDRKLATGFLLKSKNRTIPDGKKSVADKREKGNSNTNIKPDKTKTYE